ncbi:MAG TPA: oxygenase MpaB family protein [Pseudonocardia sp.]
MSRRVIADPAAGVGGIRALFLQALHPRTMAGVHQHSEFPADFWPRLRRTAEYVTTVTFGTTVEAEMAAARVRQAHRAVRGFDPVSGLRYAADDPDLLRWVHVAEVSSFLDTVRRAGVNLSEQDADSYFAEQVHVAALLGVLDTPSNQAEVAAYLANIRPELTASAITRQAALRLVLPPLPMRINLLTPARPAWASLACLAFALLPVWARAIYGVPTLPGTDIAAVAALRVLRAGVLSVRPALRPSR